MSDRELLEMAAKAAGLEIKRSRLDDPAVRDMLVFKSARNPLQQLGPWNPLTDDGDALRLAVKLGLSVRAYPIYDEPKHSVLVQKSARIVDDQCVDVAVATCSYGDTDPYAATRRCIVRAAAELGRQMP